MLSAYNPETGSSQMILAFDGVARLAFDFWAYELDGLIAKFLLNNSLFPLLYLYWEVNWGPMAILNQFVLKKPILRNTVKF